MTDQIAAVITKPPAAKRFHAVETTPFLSDGEDVVEHTVIASDPTLVIDMITAPAGFVRWRVSDGIEDRNYMVTVTITTNAGRVEPTFIQYRIRQPAGA